MLDAISQAVVNIDVRGRYWSDLCFNLCGECAMLRKDTDASLRRCQVIGGVEVDLYWLSMLVAAQGGLQSVINRKLWGAIAADLKIPRAPERDARLQACYYQYLLSYDTQSPEEKKLIEGKVIQQRVKHVAEDFGWVEPRRGNISSIVDPAAACMWCDVGSL